MKRKQIVFEDSIHRRLKNEARDGGKLLEGRAKEIVLKGWKYEELEALGVINGMTKCQATTPGNKKAFHA